MGLLGWENVRPKRESFYRGKSNGKLSFVLHEDCRLYFESLLKIFLSLEFPVLP